MVEDSIMVKKGSGSSRKIKTFGKKYRYFQQQAWTYQLVQANILEMSILYLNQAYGVKKGTYYGDFFIIGQIIPGLKPPEYLSDYEFK